MKAANVKIPNSITRSSTTQNAQRPQMTDTQDGIHNDDD